MPTLTTGNTNAPTILTVTEIERRLLETPHLEGIALRYGFFYGLGTWFAPDLEVAFQPRPLEWMVDTAVARAS